MVHSILPASPSGGTSTAVARLEADGDSSVVALGVRLPTVEASTPMLRVDEMLRADGALRGLLVRWRGTWQLIGRVSLERRLTGRFGYGRALSARQTLESMLPSNCLVLPGSASVSEAARLLLGRDPAQRFEDALVEVEDTALAVPAAAVFAGLAGVYRRAAMTDALTGLPNRLAVHAYLRELGEPAGRSLNSAAVLYVDLDRFKGVNDTFGHRAGDELLVEFAGRLQACLRPGDVVARLGGDEFAILLWDVEAPTAAAIADRIVLSAAAPFILNGCIVTIGASVGIATGAGLGELHVDAGDVLLRHADEAMYRAKQSGRGRSTHLATSDGAPEFEIARRLRAAVESDALQLVYQPKVLLSTGRVIEWEALCRWTDPVLGIVSPSEFIPVAERNGIILPLGRWVLERACQQAMAWLEAGTPAPVAVNISAVQIANDNFVREVAETLASTGLPAGLLRLELTETAALIDIPATAARLTEIRASGVLLSLDDFGTGYSSLSLLRDLPVHGLKIDKSFIETIDTDPTAQSLVKMVIDGAHDLGLTVIAEGVEREEQLSRLVALGCDAAQGYLLGYPAKASML